MWVLNDGLRIVRALQQPIRKYNYHLAIGGGVINNGESQKDLDLYFLPMGGFKEQDPPNSAGLLTFLETLWGPIQSFKEDYPDEHGIYKKTGKFFRRDRNGNTQRIDCFIF